MTMTFRIADPRVTLLVDSAENAAAIGSCQLKLRRGIA